MRACRKNGNSFLMKWRQMLMLWHRNASFDRMAARILIGLISMCLTDWLAFIIHGIQTIQEEHGFKNLSLFIVPIHCAYSLWSARFVMAQSLLCWDIMLHKDKDPPPSFTIRFYQRHPSTHDLYCKLLLYPLKRSIITVDTVHTCKDVVHYSTVNVLQVYPFHSVPKLFLLTWSHWLRERRSAEFLKAFILALCVFLTVVVQTQRIRVRTENRKSFAQTKAWKSTERTRDPTW